MTEQTDTDAVGTSSATGSAGLPRPLDGVVVVDLTRFIAGPFASMLLGDLGADVIKVEPPGGDPMRTNKSGPQLDGESIQFQSYNRNKRSITIDLGSEPGRALLLRLIDEADVLVENFRPGVAQRLGLDHETLRKTNSKLVQCAVSAFGQTGPWRDRPGFDLIVQAMGGGMSITGHPETGPAHIPFHLGDTGGGMFAALSIAAAVAGAARTGSGRLIDIGMLDCQMAFLGDEVTHLYAGTEPKQHGGGHPNFFPYQVFPTADEPVAVAAVGMDKFWPQFCDALGRPDLGNDVRYKANNDRCANAVALADTISDTMRRRPREHWLRVLQSADIPCSPLQTVREAVQHEQIVAREMVQDLSGGTGSVVVPGDPMKMDGARNPYQPAPRIGQHTEEILRDVLGADRTELTRLQSDGALG